MLHRAVVTITLGGLGLLSSCARTQEGTSTVTRPPRLMILGMRPPDPKAGERVATLLRRDLGGRVPRAKLHIVPSSDIWNALPPGLYDTLSLSDLGQLARIVSARAAVALSVDSSSAGVVLHSLLLRVERTSMQVDTLDSVVATDEGKAARALSARLASDPRLLGLPRAR